MPKHNADSRTTDEYDKYGAPIKNVEVSDIGNENHIWLAEKVSGRVASRLLHQMITDMGFEEGKIRGDFQPHIDFEVIELGTVSMDFSFHESNIKNQFTFESKYSGSNVRPPETTPVQELGGYAGEWSKALSENLGFSFDLAKIEGASYGQGSIVDYEFEYEGVSSMGDIEKAVF